MPYNRQHYKSVANILDTTHQHHRHKSSTTMGIAKDISKRNNSIEEAMRHKLQTQTPTPNHTTTQLVTKTNSAQYSIPRHTKPHNPIAHHNETSVIRDPYPMSREGTRGDPGYRKATQPLPSQQLTDITKSEPNSPTNQTSITDTENGDHKKEHTCLQHSQQYVSCHL